MTLMNDRSGAEGGHGADPQSSIEEAQEDEHEAAHEERDIHHDPWLIPASPGLRALAASIFEDLEATSPQPPRQRADATERRRAVTANLVASLAHLVLHHPAGTRLAISARDAMTTRYDRRQCPRHVVMLVLDRMEASGLIIRQRGKWGGARTTIQPTAAFGHAVAALEPHPVPFGREPGRETIILKASTGRGRPKLLLDYADTDET